MKRLISAGALLAASGLFGLLAQLEKAIHFGPSQYLYKA